MNAKFLPVLLALACAPAHAGAPTMGDVIAASQPPDWRALDPANTLYLELEKGRVIIELAPSYAPNHVENVKALAREHYWDGLAIIRSQDNYVVQWADPDAEKPEHRKIKNAKATLPAEFERALDPDVPFTRLPDGDVYAREVGFSDGFPVAREKRAKKTWLAHCYGMVGAGRDTAIDSGGGTELYAVTGHSPRQLDRNVTLLGRVVQGMELLSSLPRGTGRLGFYEKPDQYVPIKSIRIASELTESERTPLEIMRTDSPAFQSLIESRRNRPEDWFHHRAGKIELCNVPIPVRRSQPPELLERCEKKIARENAKRGALFTAIQLEDSELGKRWRNVRAEAEKEFPGLKLASPADLHLTVVYVGPKWSAKDLPELKRLAVVAPTGSGRYRLVPAEMGEKHQIMALELKAIPAAWGARIASAKANLNKLGLKDADPFDAVFRAHISLAEAKNIDDPTVSYLLELAKFREWMEKRLELGSLKMELSPYTRIQLLLSGAELKKPPEGKYALLESFLAERCPELAP
jgi:peptidylprolyl isomerase